MQSPPDESVVEVIEKEEPLIWGVLFYAGALLVCGFLMWRNPSGGKFYLALAALVAATLICLFKFWTRWDEPVALRIDDDGVSQREGRTVWRFIPWSDLQEVRFYTDGTKVDALLFLGSPGAPEKVETPLVWKGRPTVRATDNAIFFTALRKLYGLDELLEKTLRPRLDASVRFEVIPIANLGSDPVVPLSHLIREQIVRHRRA